MGPSTALPPHLSTSLSTDMALVPPFTNNAEAGPSHTTTLTTAPSHSTTHTASRSTKRRRRSSSPGLDLALQPHAPPAFYPGDDIPTLLCAQVAQPEPLHGLDLTLSLVGTLRAAGESKTICCVSASLLPALCMWAGCSVCSAVTRHDHQLGDVLLPGTYALPLRATVPLHLPASTSSTFRISYVLRAQLSQRTGTQSAQLGFDLLPATVPQHFPTSAVSATVAGWRLSPSLPSCAFSPTERIPIVLEVWRDPEDPNAHLGNAGGGSICLQAALVKEERIVSGTRSVMHYAVSSAATSSSHGVGTNRVQICLPLMSGEVWGHGYTTSAEGRGITASASFHVRLDVIIHPDTRHTFTLPIVIGSVAEPRGAVYSHTWSDIEWCAGSGRGRLVAGNALSSENGWVVPPPSYAQALEVPPYVTP